MTKTIKGVCGKCNMNQHIKETKRLEKTMSNAIKDFIKRWYLKSHKVVILK